MDSCSGSPYQGGAWTKELANGPASLGVKVSPESILPGVALRGDVPNPVKSPWNGIGLLNFLDSGNLVLVGTGFLVKADVLVTAGHNLIEAKYDSVGLWMCYDAVNNPGGSSLRILANARHRTLDLAIFILGSSHNGVFQMDSMLPAGGGGVGLAGYGMPYNDGTARFSYGEGSLSIDGAGKLSYLINTAEGDSGAPVFNFINGISRAIGVHTHAATNVDEGNTGIHLTPLIVQEIQSMIDWARQQIGGGQ